MKARLRACKAPTHIHTVANKHTHTHTRTHKVNALRLSVHLGVRDDVARFGVQPETEPVLVRVRHRGNELVANLPVDTVVSVPGENLGDPRPARLVLRDEEARELVLVSTHAIANFVPGVSSLHSKHHLQTERKVMTKKLFFSCET